MLSSDLLPTPNSSYIDHHPVTEQNEDDGYQL